MQTCNKTKQLWQEQEVGVNDPASTPFKKHLLKLSVVTGVFVYNGDVPVIVVPHEILLQLVLVLHYNFAHVGRDKLLDLLFDRVWYPSKYKVAHDL